MAKHRAEQAAATDFDAATSALTDISGDYAIDAAHTRIGFRVRHAMVTTVRGSFTDLSGSAHLDSADPAASSVTLRIAVASVDTGQEDRDVHLRSPDFFDTASHPDITFTSTEVEQVDTDVFGVTGDLEIKGVSRPVSIDFTLTGSARDPFGNLRVGFEGAVVILRSDWGLSWNAALETGGVLVSDKIQIEFDVSAVTTGLPTGHEAEPAADDAVDETLTAALMVAGGEAAPEGPARG